MNKKVAMGRFGAPHGIQGWIKVQPYSSRIPVLLEYKTWFIEENQSWKTIQIQDGKVYGNFLVVQVEGIHDRDDVRQYTNRVIYINKEELEILAPGEFYWDDLIGLKVINQEGIEFGFVHSLLETGANDVLIIRQGKKEYLVPYVNSVIKEVDLARGILLVDWIFD